MDIRCAICLESLDANVNYGATKCGHVFTCLAGWLSYSKTCPTCRLPIQMFEVKRLYFTTNISDQAMQTDELLRDLTCAGERESILKAEVISLQSKLKPELKRIVDLNNKAMRTGELVLDLTSAGERESILKAEVISIKSQQTAVRPYGPQKTAVRPYASFQ